MMKRPQDLIGLPQVGGAGGVNPIITRGEQIMPITTPLPPPPLTDFQTFLRYWHGFVDKNTFHVTTKLNIKERQISEKMIITGHIYFFDTDDYIICFEIVSKGHNLGQVVSLRPELLDLNSNL